VAFSCNKRIAKPVLIDCLCIYRVESRSIQVKVLVFFQSEQRKLSVLRQNFPTKAHFFAIIFLWSFF